MTTSLMKCALTAESKRSEKLKVDHSKQEKEKTDKKDTDNLFGGDSS